MEQNQTNEKLIIVDKVMTFVHMSIFVLSWAMLLFSIVYTLISYGNLNAEIGIHFGSDGYFDNYGSKNWVFYPLICSLVILSIVTFVALKINKVKLGINLLEKGDFILRRVFRSVCDVVVIMISIFFTEWSICIINQYQLYTVIPVFALFSIVISFAVLFIMLIIVNLLYKYVPPPQPVLTKKEKRQRRKQKNKQKSKRRKHRR